MSIQNSTENSGLNFSLFFQGALVWLNVFLTFVNVVEGKMIAAGVTAGAACFCMIGAFRIVAEMIVKGKT